MFMRRLLVKVCGVAAAAALVAGSWSCGDDAEGSSGTPTGPGTGGSGGDGAGGGETTGGGGEGGDGEGGGASGCVQTATGPTRGSALALRSDDGLLLVANRDAGTVASLPIDAASDPPTIGTRTDLVVGDEP
ncbi:MAG: hypothetical protein RIF41_41195, partial [Polyangiaceae bacterium]